MFSAQTTRHVVEQRRLLAFVPLLVLGAHFYLFPFLYSSTQKEDVPGARELVDNEKVHIGRYQGHEIITSLGDFEDPEYLNQASNPSAVVVAHYLALPGAASRTGGAGKSLQLLLNHLSPTEGERYQEFLRDTVSASKGEIKTFRISQATPTSLSHIFIVMLDITDSAEAHLQVLRNGLKEIIAVSDRLKVETLFIPTLTVDPRHPNAVGGRDFFEALFDAIPVSRHPRQIQLSLYRQWPSSFLSSVLRSLNEVWQERISKKSAWSERLFRVEFRSSMLFLSLCLLVSSTRARLNIRNAIVISLAYLGAAFGGTRTIAFLLTDHSQNLLLFSTLAFQFFLAIFLYAYVYWDPKKTIAEALEK